MSTPDYRAPIVSNWIDPALTQTQSRRGDTFNPNPYPQADSTEAASGYSGAMTPASTTNATNTPAKSGPNVFTAVLDHVNSVNNAFSGGYGGDGPVTKMPDDPSPIMTQPPLRRGSPPPTTTPPPAEPPVINVPQQPGTAPSQGRGRAVAPVNPSSGTYTHDANGTPYSAQNPPPKPPGTEDPAVAAEWYKKFAYLNPDFLNVTAADVNAYRTSGFQGDFATWYTTGKQTPAQNPPPPPTGAPIVSNWIDPALGATQQHRPGQQGTGPVVPPGTVEGHRGQPPPSGTPPPTSAGGIDSNGRPFTGGSGGVGTTTTPPPAARGDAPPLPPPTGTPPLGTPPPAPSSTEEITKLIDLFNSGKGPQQPPIEDMLNPMFARQRQQLGAEMDAQAAATGAGHSGGYGENRATALSNLSGQQSAALAGEMGQEYLAKLNQNTQLTQLATQAGMQKYIADIGNDMERYKVNTNDDLQRWLTDKNNTLTKYGIDTNDVLQRYLGKLGIDKANIDAKAQVDAAALHAAAAEAGAGAASAAAQMNANVNLQLGTGNLQVEREKNMGNFILGLLGLGQTGLGDLGNIFNNFPAGSFVVKP